MGIIIILQSTKEFVCDFCNASEAGKNSLAAFFALSRLSALFLLSQTVITTFNLLSMLAFLIVLFGVFTSAVAALNSTFVIPFEFPLFKQV